MTGPVELGDRAPDFDLRDQHGRQQTLSSRHGVRNVLLVFYPFAFTGVCTSEMTALSDNTTRFDELGVDVLAVSCDPVPSLRAFADSAGLTIPLLSDFWPHGEVSCGYGAFDDVLGAAGRRTFAIDKSGTIRWTIGTAIPNARDVAEYLRVLTRL